MFDPEQVMQEIRKDISEKKIPIAKQYLATSYYEHMIQECREKRDIIIFGAGSYGLLLYRMLQKEKIDTVRCFCDNNKTKQGSTIKGLQIYPLEDARKRYPDAFFLVTTKGYENEVMRQLVKAGVSVDDMAFFIMAYTGLVV